MNALKNALENVMQKDAERYEQLGGEHEFSEKFEREMERLAESAAPKKRPKRLRIVRTIAAAAAAVALFAAGTLAGAVSSGFNIGRESHYGKPFNVFTAVDSEGCPETVETAYVLGGFPRELMSISKSGDGKLVTADYFPGPLEDLNNDELYMGRVIHLWQETKDSFTFRYPDMERVTFETLTVNGGQAYYITRERYYGMDTYLFWESEDYIFTLCGGFLSREEIIELAGTLEVYDGEMPFSGLRREEEV